MNSFTDTRHRRRGTVLAPPLPLVLFRDAYPVEVPFLAISPSKRMLRTTAHPVNATHPSGETCPTERLWTQDSLSLRPRTCPQLTTPELSARNARQYAFPADTVLVQRGPSTGPYWRHTFLNRTQTLCYGGDFERERSLSGDSHALVKTPHWSDLTTPLWNRLAVIERGDSLHLRSRRPLDRSKGPLAYHGCSACRWR